MKIDYAILSDAAQAAGGKIYILGGGWNLFRSPSYPAVVQIGLALGLSFTSNEVGIKLPLSVVIADEAGVPVVPEVKAQVETGQPAPDLPNGLSIKVPLAIQIGLSVPRPGKYGILATAGSSKVELSFDAILLGQRVEFSAGSPSTELGN